MLKSIRLPKTHKKAGLASSAKIFDKNAFEICSLNPNMANTETKMALDKGLL